MFTIQVLEVKIESLKNECHQIIICKFGTLLFALIGAWWNASKYVGWRWSLRWARWHQGWMSPWGTTIATLTIVVQSTLQDASNTIDTLDILRSRCKNIATLVLLYFAARSVIANLGSPCLIMCCVHCTPQIHTWVQTIAFPAFTKLRSAHIKQHDGEYYRDPHHTVDCAKFFQWHILLPTVQQSSV